MAASKGVTAAQLCVAWVRAKGDRIIPLLGARTRKQLDESLGALSVQLSSEELADLERAIPASAVAGSRYQEPQMQMLDSERA